jgi:aminoglycoside phosphotransferase (APT) family kinase protein
VSGPTPEAPAGADLEALAPWFAAHVDADGGPLTATLIAGGRSNLTYLVTNGVHEWVLRRPPLGHVIETAHDMRREFRVISALAGTDVPVPTALAFCDDVAVNGAPFYVMSRVEGRILRTDPELATLDAADARRVSGELVDTLAHLHAIDFATVGLGDFGRPEGFLARNVARWGKQWQANKTRDLPEIDELARRLVRARPESGPPSIVHGDYRLDNTMLAPTKPEIAAVLDWEMSTLGDPLTDLGLFLVYWSHWSRDGHGTLTYTEHGSNPPGFFTDDEIVARYGAASGRDLTNLDFYVAFAMYKLAVILEGIHARFLLGKTLGEGFDHIGDVVEAIVAHALERSERSDFSARHP